MARGSEVTVLVVDDEKPVADAYALQIESRYETRIAYGGEEALEAVNAEVDVVLLDRRMPDYSGDDVLEELRERGLDCRVIMVTAVDPDFDIVDMPFDDYLQKPVGREDLFGAIDRQLSVEQYDDSLDEFMQLSAKLELLEAEKPRQELDDHTEVQRIRQRANELKSELDQTVTEFEDPATAFEYLV